MSLEKAIEANTAAIHALIAALGAAEAITVAKADSKTDKAEAKKSSAGTASSQPGAEQQTTAQPDVAQETVAVLDYEKDIKPVALSLAAKKGRDALVAVYTKVGVTAKDAKPAQYPAMLAALNAALAG